MRLITCSRISFSACTRSSSEASLKYLYSNDSKHSSHLWMSYWICRITTYSECHKDGLQSP